MVALTYATAVDIPERYPRSRDVGAHFGLTPRKYASGEIDRNGSISKAGEQMARQALFHAALSLLTRNELEVIDDPAEQFAAMWENLRVVLRVANFNLTTLLK